MQSALNHALLVHRRTYRLFPDVEGVDYVVVDAHRPFFRLATREAFFRSVEKIREDFETVVDWDGFLILRRAGIRD